MSGLSTLTILTIAWAAVTAVFFALLIIRSLVGMKEEDTLILSVGHSMMADQQKEVQGRLSKLRPILRGVGFLSVALLLAIIGIWVYRGVNELFAN